MSGSYYVSFPHLFVGFGHEYINAKQSDTGIHTGIQSRSSQRHLGQTRFARQLSDMKASQNTEFNGDLPKAIW